MTVWYPHLKARLDDFSIDQQLLLVGNELHRARNLQTDLNEFRNSLERALEILDLITDSTRSLSRSLRRELRRFRAQIARTYLTSVPNIDSLIRVGLQLNRKNWLILGA